jgi:hypothetical protein
MTGHPDRHSDIHGLSELFVEVVVNEIVDVKSQNKAHVGHVDEHITYRKFMTQIKEQIVYIKCR